MKRKEPTESQEVLMMRLLDSYGDREKESVAAIALARSVNPQKGANGNDGKDTYTRFITKVIFAGSDCWYWYGALHKLGYGLMNALGESKAHRVSWRLHYGDIPNGMMVLHKCDVRNCVNPDHLFIGTQTDNMQDMISKGRNFVHHRVGEFNPVSKFSNQQAQSIREEFAAGGVLQIELARKYDVSPMAISRLIRKETYNEF